MEECSSDTVAVFKSFYTTSYIQYHIATVNKLSIFLFSISIPILIWVYLHKWGWPDLPHSDSNLSNSHCNLHLAQFNASSFFKPTLLLSFSTCIFHVFLGRPRFLLPFTSNSNAFLKTCPSSLLNTCPYHLTPFAFAI